MVALDIRNMNQSYRMVLFARPCTFSEKNVKNILWLRRAPLLQRYKGQISSPFGADMIAEEQCIVNILMKVMAKLRIQSVVRGRWKC